MKIRNEAENIYYLFEDFRNGNFSGRNFKQGKKFLNRLQNNIKDKITRKETEYLSAMLDLFDVRLQVWLSGIITGIITLIISILIKIAVTNSPASDILIFLNVFLNLNVFQRIQNHNIRKRMEYADRNVTGLGYENINVLITVLFDKIRSENLYTDDINEIFKNLNITEEKVQSLHERLEKK